MQSLTPTFWRFDPVFIGGLLTVALIYMLTVGPLRHRLAPNSSFPTWRAVAFCSALLVFFLAEASPLHDIAELYLFSAHMFQHLLLGYVVSLLLLVGLPDYVLRILVLNRLIKPIATILSKPVTAAVIYTIVFSAWHFPAIYEAQLRSEVLHSGEHLIFIAASMIAAWQLTSPLPELPRLSNVGQILYLTALPFGQFLVTALLTFSQSPIYETYAASPKLFGLTTVGDQQLGGILMKVAGFLIYGIPLILAFFRWHREENPVRRMTSRQKLKTTRDS